MYFIFPINTSLLLQLLPLSGLPGPRGLIAILESRCGYIYLHITYNK